jgi:FkbM family methyltransferase
MPAHNCAATDHVTETLAGKAARGPGEVVTAPLFVLVDIGARGGVEPRWQPFADALHVVAIDADESAEVPDFHGVAHFERIRASVGPSEGAVEFYVTRSVGASSILRPNREFLAQFPEPERFDVVEVTTVQSRPLDALVRERRLHSVDFIKLDTQGSELSILRGADEALASVVGIEVEVEFAPLYEGQPLFGEIDEFLRARGFELFDLNRVYWRRSGMPATGRGQLMFGDALYFRSANGLVDVPGGRGLVLAKAVLAATAYGYLDYAGTLLAWGSERQMFQEGEAAMAAEWLGRARHGRHRLARLTGNVRGAGRVSRALARLADVFRPDHWAYVDGRLGNSSK